MSLGAREETTGGHLLEFTVLFGGVGDDVLVGVGIILHALEFGGVGGIDGDGIGLEVL